MQDTRYKGRSPFSPLYLFPCLFALLLSGCGFHLRDAVTLPPAVARMQLEGLPARGPLTDEITMGLEAAGVQVVSSGGGAVLRITRQQMDRHLLSVDSLGRASEYELSFRLGYVLHAPPSAAVPGTKPAPPTVWVQEHTVTVVRDYIYDPNNVLGMSDKEEQLRQEMMRSAVRQMLVQLEAELHGRNLP